ncbi:hypothetical protein DICPUDRAFT_47628 [Dictyostelium purpureum]|uniref:Endonuclease/exonuclease/phosphatase domain-containing protein n=1 Tax=Dictyostelium purpureum TaxID=5786 RepID=F0ZKI0_DICPU|nr:uncharacterized protein DICPUDRAFT_47628 [Dictyostelium purpureum]EGC35545.1 hypothetical protein DICPUDRAFT_47628 [Dictyostelium purpureum]|eukprot:XP_003287916.1 hypothetical protein DICPUDRAFT_47628 [Dictyostelium purpureum]
MIKNKILFLIIVIVLNNFVILINSYPTTSAGIVGEYESLSIGSKEINNVLGQLKSNINLNRYFFLNNFKTTQNLNIKAKYFFPIYQIDLVEGKKQVQYLSLNGDGENLKTRQPVSNNRNGYPQYQLVDFPIGTVYDISVYMDTNIQTSKTYESFLRNESLSTSNDYKTKKLLDEKCTYLKLKLFKDYLGLLSTQQFLCFDSFEDLVNNNKQGNDGIKHQNNQDLFDSTISNLQYTGNSGNSHIGGRGGVQNAVNQIKVMSYNTWNFNDPWRERRVKMADVILNESPDIICFQEIRYSSWTSEAPFKSSVRKGEERNQVQHIWKLLSERNQKYHFTYLPSMVYNTNTGLQFEGLAIFSKHPITDISSIKLSREVMNADDAHQRSLLRAQVYLKQHDLNINVFTSHFSLEAEGSKRNAYESLKYINEFPKPHLFMGDLNLEPSANAIQYLIGDYEINNHAGNLKDTWMEYSSRKLEENSNQDIYLDQLRNQVHSDCKITDYLNGYTFPTLYGAPNKRIDYLFRSNDNNLKVLDFHIKGRCKEIPALSSSSSKTSTNSDSNHLYPSDHTSIVTTFEILN